MNEREVIDEWKDKIEWTYDGDNQKFYIYKLIKVYLN